MFDIICLYMHILNAIYADKSEIVIHYRYTWNIKIQIKKEVQRFEAMDQEKLCDYILSNNWLS